MNEITMHEYKKVFHECENLAKQIQNLNDNLHRTKIAWLVNALAFRLTIVLWCTGYITTNNQVVDMFELRQTFRWLQVILTSRRGKFLYFLKKRNRDIIFWTVSWVERDYRNLIMILLECWGSIIHVHSVLENSISQLPED